MPEIINTGFGQQKRRFPRLTPAEVRARWSVDHDVGLLIRLDGTIEPAWLQSHGYLLVALSDIHRHAKEYLHRLIFCHCEGWFPEIVDHINGNRLDNRPGKLRPATPQLNAVNRRSSLMTNIKPLVGVDGFAVSLTVGKVLLTGTAPTLAEAVAVRTELKNAGTQELLKQLAQEDAEKRAIERAWALGAVGAGDLAQTPAGLIVPPPPRWIIEDKPMTGPRKFAKPDKRKAESDGVRRLRDAFRTSSLK